MSTGEKDDFIKQQIKRYFKYTGKEVPDKDIDDNPIEWLKKMFLDYGVYVWNDHGESLEDMLAQGNRKLNTLPYMTYAYREYFPEKDFPGDHLELTRDNPYNVDTYSITDFIPDEKYGKDLMVTPEEYHDLQREISREVIRQLDIKAKEDRERQKNITDAISDPWRQS